MRCLRAVEEKDAVLQYAQRLEQNNESLTRSVGAAIIGLRLNGALRRSISSAFHLWRYKTTKGVVVEGTTAR